MSIIYPQKPPMQPDKSVLEKLKESKDIDIGLWFTHDPAIYKDPSSGNYYFYGTEAVCQRSKDLINWEKLGKVTTVPKEAAEWTGSDRNIWAPDIVKVGDEYRLYCSNSSWGVRQSCIFLAVSDNAEGPFEPRGIVLKTNDESDTNAIDANIITDQETGQMYMVYGSFWDGCHILKLDNETGLAAEEGTGKCLARRPEWLSTSLEGPYMIYNPDTKYYYLFVSYGSLKMDYQIRVGRSKSVLGPFLDFNGRDMADLSDDGNNIGLMQYCGYKWNEGVAYMSPGHNSVLRDDDGSWYIVNHIREKKFKRNDPGPSTMQIRKLFWTEDGWPLVSPEQYAGEIDQEIPKSEIQGFYERINLISTLPQGIQTSVPMVIEDENDYYECCSIQGKWSYENNQITIKYGPHEDKAYVTAVWDWEIGQATIALCGMSKDGIPFWAKRVSDV